MKKEIHTSSIGFGVHLLTGGGEIAITSARRPRGCYRHEIAQTRCSTTPELPVISEEHAVKYSAGSLESLANTILAGFGCEKEECDIVAEHLVSANLAGHDSHGVGMLPVYGKQVEDGNLIPNQTPEIISATGAVTVVDARRGFGHRMALLALDEAIKSCRKNKVAVLGLRNSGHVSRTGHYSEYCAKHGLISLHFVNVWGHAPLVAAYGSSEPAFSTNPISIGIPVNGNAKPMLDLATSTVAFGKVRVAHNRGQKIPLGWVIDDAGSPTDDPSPIWLNRSGALTPFGKHKGSGLAIFVELLAGAIAGTETVATGNYIPNGVFNNMFSILVDPQAFDTQDEIEERVMEFYQSIKTSRPATETHDDEQLKSQSEVLMPGEPELNYRLDRERYGIDVDPETIEQLVSIGEDFGSKAVDLRHLLEQTG